MRRVGMAGSGVGMAAVHASEEAARQSQALGDQMHAERVAHIGEQVGLFRTRLEEFAIRHRAEINKDPQFRHHFIRMAKSIGVDPLSSTKGWAAEKLGIDIGSFYADLAVQVAHVCMATRPMNGGLIAMPDLVRQVNAMRGSRAGGVNDEDVRRSLGKLAVLGGGYKEVAVGAARYVSSVPDLLSGDTAATLSAAGAAPERYLTLASLCRATGWPADRADRSLKKLLKEGVAWLDRAPVMHAVATATAAGGGAASSSAAVGSAGSFEERYYFPSLSLGSAAAQ